MVGIGLTAAATTTQREIFPFYSWFLFATVPNGKTTYQVVLHRVNGQEIDPALPLNQASALVGGNARSIVLYRVVQRYGQALRNGDAAGAARERGYLEAKLPAATRYEVVRERGDAIERWHHHGTPIVESLGFFDSVATTAIETAPASESWVTWLLLPLVVAGLAFLAFSRRRWERLLRPLRHFFSGNPGPGRPGSFRHSFPFRRQTAAWRQATLLTRVYYVTLAYLAVELIPQWTARMAVVPVHPLWPIGWLAYLPPHGTILGILSFYLAGAMMAAIFPEYRVARVAAFLGVLFFVAYDNSFGKIGHSMHGWVLTSAVLVFLPPHGSHESSRRATRQGYLQIFWTAAVILSLVYTLAGLGKVGGFFYQLVSGEMTVLHPKALAEQVAERLSQTDSESVVGSWIIDHYWAGWPLYLGMIYIQFFSLWAVFRPVLLRPWAVALLLFHVGSYFVFTILFLPNVLLVGFLFLASPWARPLNLGPAMWRELPLIGIAVRRFQARMAR